jgi:hypothetical protein
MILFFELSQNLERLGLPILTLANNTGSSKNEPKRDLNFWLVPRALLITSCSPG